jgi:branched-subunit amino acid transport protein
MSDLVLLALMTGAATWAFRVLPTMLRHDRLAPGGWLERFLTATGPAAIATLVVAAILPTLSAEADRLIPLALGVLAVLAVWAASRSVVAATLAGAVLHGLAVWAQAALLG